MKNVTEMGSGMYLTSQRNGGGGNEFLRLNLSLPIAHMLFENEVTGVDQTIDSNLTFSRDPDL